MTLLDKKKTRATNARAREMLSLAPLKPMRREETLNIQTGNQNDPLLFEKSGARQNQKRRDFAAAANFGATNSGIGGPRENSATSVGTSVEDRLINNQTEEIKAPRIASKFFKQKIKQPKKSNVRRPPRGARSDRVRSLINNQTGNQRRGAKLDFISSSEKSSFRGTAGKKSSWKIKKSSLHTSRGCLSICRLGVSRPVPRRGPHPRSDQKLGADTHF